MSNSGGEELLTRFPNSCSKNRALPPICESPHSKPSKCNPTFSKEEHVIAPLAKLLDWSSIQAAVLMMPANDLNSKLEKAIQFLSGPDFIPAQSAPAQVQFNGSLDFTFTT